MKSLSFARLAAVLVLLTGVAVSAYMVRMKPTWPINEVAIGGEISTEQRAAVYQFLDDANVADLAMQDIRSQTAFAERWRGNV